MRYNLCSAQVYERGVIGVGGKVDRFREGDCRQEVSYRGELGGGEWGDTHGYDRWCSRTMYDGVVQRGRVLGVPSPGEIGYVEKRARGENVSVESGPVLGSWYL